MNKLVSAAVGLVTAWMLVGHAHQMDDDKPLGDVAREQRAIHKRQQHLLTEGSSVPSKARYSPGITSGLDANPSRQSVLDSTSVEERLVPPPTSEPEAIHSLQHAHDEHSCSALDGSKPSSADVVILEAGTEIKVDVDEQKVIVPVRAGFATVIPALSKVTVKSSRQFINADDSNGSFQYTSYVDYVRITAVTVEGTLYETETNSVPLLKGNASHEVTFTLASPIAISR